MIWYDVIYYDMIWYDMILSKLMNWLKCPDWVYGWQRGQSCCEDSGESEGVDR